MELKGWIEEGGEGVDGCAGLEGGPWRDKGRGNVEGGSCGRWRRRSGHGGVVRSLSESDVVNVVITSRYAYDTSSPYLYDPRLQEITNLKFTC